MDKDDSNNNITSRGGNNHTPNNYALNGKIMLCSVIILFVAVIFIACFHSYARWVFHRQNRIRRRRLLRTHNHLLQSPSSATGTTVYSQGLGVSALKSIPSFVYSSNKHNAPLECVVCLSEFEDNEEGRVLPKCNHTFHVDCIDAWFRTRSNCPLCRAPVQPENPVHNPPENCSAVTVVSVSEPAGSGPKLSPPGLCPSCHQGEDIEMGSSSSSSSSSSPSVSCQSLSPVTFQLKSCRRKRMELVGILAEMPRGFDDMGLGPLEGPSSS